MKKMILMALALLLAAACSPGEDEKRMTPSPRPLKLTSSIEQARAASLPGASLADESEEIEESRDDGGKAGDAKAERVAPSGSVNLNDLTPESESELTETTPIVQPAPGAPNLQTMVEQKALQDLANRLDVPVEEVELLSEDEVEWPDGSLG